jgi:hypothetical protein
VLIDEKTSVHFLKPSARAMLSTRVKEVNLLSDFEDRINKNMVHHHISLFQRIREKGVKTTRSNRSARAEKEGNNLLEARARTISVSRCLCF